MAKKKRKPPIEFTTSAKARDKSWAVIGMDTSVSSIAGACFGYDAVLDRNFGVGTHSMRWRNDKDEYMDRLAACAAAQIFTMRLMSVAGAPPLNLDRTWIGVEEAWPVGVVRMARGGKGKSNHLRQQAEIRGALVGGLTKWGYRNIHEVNSQSWKGVIAKDLGITVSGGIDFKWVVKEWGIDYYGIERMPDLIRKQGVGLIHQPETSKAKADQPNDIYDAVGVMNWMLEEVADELQ